jgi:RNA polymerase sigma-70 factor (ECF subfamily)
MEKGSVAFSEPWARAIRLYRAVDDLDALLSRCRGGDALAWEELVRRFEARIYGFALHDMHDREEARDVAQEIFVKMYQGMDGMRDARTYVPWMLRLARNCCIDRIRGRNARARDLDAEAFAPEQACPAASPEQSLLEDARRALLYRALATLTGANREILLLKDIEQLPLSDISARLGLPLGTVKSRTNRARSELAKADRSLDAAAGAVS